MKKVNGKPIAATMGILCAFVYVLLSWSMPETACAETFHVDGGNISCDDGGACNSSTPCCTIQAAIDKASDGSGDTILVNDNSYDGFVVYKNTITVKAADGAHPVINGNGIIVPIADSPDAPSYIVVGASQATIDGFTMNGYEGDGIDVGILVGGNSVITLVVDGSTRTTKPEARNVTIINNSVTNMQPVDTTGDARDRGYGLFIDGSGDVANGNATNLSVLYNNFSQNHRGIGIFGDVGDTSIHYNKIADNDKCDETTAWWLAGHGIGRYYASGNPVHAEINWWGDASGLSDLCQPSPVVDACDETPVNGSGDEIFFEGEVCFYPWCTTEDDNDGDGVCDNLDICPQIPNGPALGTCAEHIGVISRGTGVTCTSDGECESAETCQMRQEDCNDNGMGDACECYADFDADGNVYPNDLSVFLGDYGRTDCTINPPPCEADIDGDGNVYPGDLSVFLEEYGREDCPVLE